MRSLLSRVILVAGFPPFITVNISYHSLLVCRVSVEIATVNIMGIPLYVTCCFSLAAFNNFSLCLIFVSLINMSLSVFLFGLILCGTLGFFDIRGYFLSQIREFLTYNLLKYFLIYFLFLFFFYDSYNLNVHALVPEVSETVLISFFSFSLCFSASVIFNDPIFQLTYAFFCLSYPAIGSL